MNRWPILVFQDGISYLMDRWPILVFSSYIGGIVCLCAVVYRKIGLHWLIFGCSTLCFSSITGWVALVACFSSIAGQLA